MEGNRRTPKDLSDRVGKATLVVKKVLAMQLRGTKVCNICIMHLQTPFTPMIICYIDLSGGDVTCSYLPDASLNHKCLPRLYAYLQVSAPYIKRFQQQQFRMHKPIYSIACLPGLACLVHACVIVSLGLQDACTYVDS